MTFFLQRFYHRKKSANQSTVHIRVDGQALQNRTTLGDVIVISIVNIALKIQQSEMLTGVLEGLEKYFLFNFFCGSRFGTTYF